MGSRRSSTGSIVEMFEAGTAWKSGDDIVIIVPGGRTLAVPKGHARKPDVFRDVLMARHVDPEMAQAIVPEALKSERLKELCD